MLTFTKNDGSTIAVDLPLELLIESGRYDETNSQIVLVLANGNSINIPVSDLLDDFYGKNETYNKTEVDNLISQKQRQIEALEDEIDELIEENKSQQEEIDMLTADYRENTIEGETVAVSDGLAKSKIKADVNGNSYQYSTEGINEFEVTGTSKSMNGVDFTVNKDKSINVVGTATTTSATMFIGKKTLETGTYTLYFPNMIYAWGTARVEVSGSTFSTLGFSSSTNKKVLTLTEQDTLNFNAIISVTGTAINFTIYPMIIKGDVTANLPTYEPYTNGASPNIEYPQEVEVITECSLVQRGKNVFNEEDFINYISSQGIRVTEELYNGVECYKFARVSQWQARYPLDFLSPDSDYTITLTGIRIGNCSLELHDENKTRINVLVNTNFGQVKITSDKAKSIYLGMYATDGTSYIYIAKGSIQLEKGSIATTYEPYIEPIVKPINLNGNSIAKVGNVKDLLNIGVDGRVSIEKNTKEDVITGTNTSNIKNYLLVTSTVGNDLLACVFNILDTLKSSKAIICNKFVTKTLGSVTDTGNSENVRFYEGIAKHNNYNEQYVLSVKKSRLQTENLQGILDLLAEEQPKILYAIATPITITLPSIEPITLFEGTNVFELVTNLGTTLAVTYKVSNKSRLENLELALLSNGGNV